VLLLPSASGAVVLNPAAVRAACGKDLTYTDHIPQAAADGAKMKWETRTVHADDWASGGFAAQVMWVGTDDRQADDAWVEVGFTHGWQGSNVTTFYTARRKTDNTYTEWRFTGMDTSVNRLWTFSAYYVATSSYYAVIADGITTNYKVWSGHGRDTVDYSGGSEATCDTSQINRTFVEYNRFRRKSDGTYVNIDNGTKQDQAVSGGIAWCNQPLTFRYWENSSIATGLCS